MNVRHNSTFETLKVFFQNEVHINGILGLGVIGFSYCSKNKSMDRNISLNVWLK